MAALPCDDAEEVSSIPGVVGIASTLIVSDTPSSIAKRRAVRGRATQGYGCGHKEVARLSGHWETAARGAEEESAATREQGATVRLPVPTGQSKSRVNRCHFLQAGDLPNRPLPWYAGHPRKCRVRKQIRLAIFSGTDSTLRRSFWRRVVCPQPPNPPHPSGDQTLALSRGLLSHANEHGFGWRLFALVNGPRRRASRRRTSGGL